MQHVRIKTGRKPIEPESPNNTEFRHEYGEWIAGFVNMFWVNITGSPANVIHATKINMRCNMAQYRSPYTWSR